MIIYKLQFLYYKGYTITIIFQIFALLNYDEEDNNNNTHGIAGTSAV